MKKYIREAKSEKIVFANKKFSQIHGVSLEKIIGMNSRDLLTDRERERIKRKPLSRILREQNLK